MDSRFATFSIATFSDYSNIPGQFSSDFIKATKVVKVSETESQILIAATDSSTEGIKTIQTLNQTKSTEVIFVKESDFAEFIGSFVEEKEITDSHTDNSKNEISLETISSNAPVVNIINAICLEAIRKNSSDIHIQCLKNDIRVRLRIDGVLQTVKILDKGIQTTLTNRIKVMAGLNVMENRNCQDGRISVQANHKNYDFRVSIVPCVSGQSIVLRLFNLEENNLQLEELGFSEQNYQHISNALHLANGIVLVTGPTGSGKTTTLHALISKMDKEHLKIITIEDPVEKVIEGVDQIQVNESIGLTFESVLRRILRQDPDVIMVGEIRDKDTANLSIRAALTGHLILSTLHTNDSLGAITRLRNLGVESYLIADVLKMSISQRLVRKLCKKCNGIGCVECSFTGYKGRTCVSEIFECDDTVRKLIEEENSEQEIKKYITKKGFKPISEDAKQKVQSGICDIKEITRECIYEN